MGDRSSRVVTLDKFLTVKCRHLQSAKSATAKFRLPQPPQRHQSARSVTARFKLLLPPQSVRSVTARSRPPPLLPQSARSVMVRYRPRPQFTRLASPRTLHQSSKPSTPPQASLLSSQPLLPVSSLLSLSCKKLL